ncbi:hypothetical protein GQ457_15G016320 [Hibiscus cannabinus]
MSQQETTGPVWADFLADSDLSRASCRVIGLCLSPNNYSACLYAVPSTVELSPHAIRCRKVPFLTRRNLSCIFLAAETLLIPISRRS